MAEFKVYGMTVNYLKNPCGIDENPSISYKLSSGKRGGAQKTRRVSVKEALTGETVWDTGVITQLLLKIILTTPGKITDFGAFPGDFLYGTEKIKNRL